MQENQAKSKTTRVAGEEAQNAASVLGTACLGSSDPFYSIVTYYIKLFTTSWTHSIFDFSQERDPLENINCPE